MKSIGRSGPLSLPSPSASAKTPPQRCGRAANGRQLKLANLGRTSCGNRHTRPLGSRSERGSTLAILRHHTEDGASFLLDGPTKQCSMYGGAKVPGPSTHWPPPASLPRASPLKPPCNDNSNLLKFSNRCAQSSSGSALSTALLSCNVNSGKMTRFPRLRGSRCNTDCQMSELAQARLSTVLQSTSFHVLCSSGPSSSRSLSITVTEDSVSGHFGEGTRHGMLTVLN